MAYKSVRYKGNKSGPDSERGGELEFLEWIRKFDIEFLRYLLRERQIEAGVVAIILAIGFFTFKIVADQLNKIAMVEQKISELSAKKDPVEMKSKLAKEKQIFFKNALKALPDKKFIPFLAKLAENRGITVLGFEPVIVETKEHYSVSYISFTCSSPSFSQAFLFFKDLETSPYSIKVITLRVKPRDPLDLGANSVFRQKDVPVQMEAQLSTLLVFEK